MSLEIFTNPISFDWYQDRNPDDDYKYIFDIKQSNKQFSQTSWHPQFHSPALAGQEHFKVFNFDLSTVR